MMKPFKFLTNELTLFLQELEYDEGWVASMRQEETTAYIQCPYGFGTTARDRWMAGYLEHRRQLLGFTQLGNESI